MFEMKVMDRPVDCIKGVGPTRLKLLKKLGITKVKDLLYHFPRDYIDKGNIVNVSRVKNGQLHTIAATVEGRPVDLKPRKGLVITKVAVKDKTGRAFAVWYNQPFVKKQLLPGKSYLFSGKIQIKYGEIQMVNCKIFDLSSNKTFSRIEPVYPLTEKLTQVTLRKLIAEAYKLCIHEVKEVLPDVILKRNKLPGIKTAFKNIHFPQTLEAAQRAIKRFKYQEFFLLQLALIKQKQLLKNKRGICFKDKLNISEFEKILPFSLTDSQKKVIMEIKKDMTSNKPMNRLIQGDVGSGKTIVAIAAILLAFKNNYQSAFMAPTEVLAWQQYQKIKKILSSFNVKIEYLAGSLAKNKKESILKGLRTGSIDVIVGTHSLIQENISFNNLGLVITDEEHRFGVRQRALLRGKGINPDVLVMSATPIPRTLALALYGDLDISIIDELPPNRKHVKTYMVKHHLRKRVYNFVAREVDKGRQGYIICPLIEDTQSANWKSVENIEKFIINSGYTFSFKILHGKMKTQEKEETLQKFKEGEIQVLISTSVVEVGIDVPNATVLVVENAERFGLAQLHQIRGRIGRNDLESYCILIYETDNKETLKKLKILVNNNDGFYISKKDMELRGPGELLGVKQHGLPELKIADILKDEMLLKKVMNDVKAYVED